MRPWAVLLCLGHTTLALLLASPGAEAKRHDPSMVDPLSRRSSLDKNFMRFGRSSPSFIEEDESKDAEDSLSATGTNKEDNFLRSMRGKDNFIRFGRARDDNFMRFGRGKQDSFIRFGKSLDGTLMREVRGEDDNYMRFGRGIGGNLLRFGRGKQDNYMRFGRSKQDNFMRFGRGKQDSFMRLGRAKHDNFIRFGRGKQDNYMRFGRANDVVPSVRPQVFNHDKAAEINGKPDDFMKFSRNLAGEIDIGIPIAMRSSDGNFMRFGKAREDNYMRFGKSEEKYNLLPLSKELGQDKAHYTTYPDTYARQTESKDSDLIRFGRQPPNKDDSFIRFGRNLDEQDETPTESELIPPRLKRSISTVYDPQDEFLPVKLEDDVYNHILIPFATLPNDLDEEYSPHHQRDDYMNRKKRYYTQLDENKKAVYIFPNFGDDKSAEPLYTHSDSSPDNASIGMSDSPPNDLKSFMRNMVI